MYAFHSEYYQGTTGRLPGKNAPPGEIRSTGARIEASSYSCERFPLPREMKSIPGGIPSLKVAAETLGLFFL